MASELERRALADYQEYLDKLLKGDELVSPDLHSLVDHLITEPNFLGQLKIDPLIKLQMIRIAAIQALVKKENDRRRIVLFDYPEYQLLKNCAPSSGLVLAMASLRNVMIELDSDSLKLIPLDIQIRLLELTE